MNISINNDNNNNPEVVPPSNVELKNITDQNSKAAYNYTKIRNY